MRSYFRSPSLASDRGGDINSGQGPGGKQPSLVRDQGAALEASMARKPCSDQAAHAVAWKNDYTTISGGVYDVKIF